MYQNNNNRITPNEVLNVNIQPQASPVDTTVQYRAENPELERKRATINALIKLGQGIVDVQPVWKRQADENMLEQFNDKQGNKREWNEASSKLKGMAIFNPYNKDAYKKLVGQDIYEEAKLKLYSKPDFYKADRTSLNKHIQNTEKELRYSLTQAGLSPRHCVEAISYFEKDKEALLNSYVQKNAEYGYKLTGVKVANNIHIQLFDVSMQEGAGIETYKQVITDILNSDELSGFYPADRAAVLLSGIESFIGNNAGDIDETELIGALDGVNINGQSLRDFIPDYGIKINELAAQARRKAYSDKKLQYDMKELEEAENFRNASAEMFDYISKNPDFFKNSEEYWKYGVNIINKYGLQSNSNNIFSALFKSKDFLYEAAKIRTDPNVLNELCIKFHEGTLEEEDIVTSLKSKQLAANDSFALTAKNTAIETAEDKEVKKQIDTLVALTDVKKGSMNPDYDYASSLTPQIQQLSTDYALGKIDSVTAKNKIQQLNRTIELKKKIAEKDTGVDRKLSNKKDDDLYILQAKYRYSKRAPANDTATQKEAVKGLNIVPNGIITAGLGEKRGNHEHIAVDIQGGVVQNTGRRGTVTQAGFEKSFGNFIVIQYSNGTSLLLAHLDRNVEKLKGTTLEPYQTIAYCGKSGNVKGNAICHAEFWVQKEKGMKKEVVTPTEFYRRINKK